MNKDALLSARIEACNLARSLLWTPYRWGGDDPSGFDCSGMCVEILKGVGMLPDRGDWNSGGLYKRFQMDAVNTIKAGCLVFYGKDFRTIVHVMIAISPILAIGANSGGSRTQTTEDAWDQNAFIKIRPIHYRKDFLTAVDPFRGTVYD